MLVADVGLRDAERRPHRRGLAGDDDRVDAERLRVADGVERARAAVGHQDEVARVEAAADDLVLERVRHLRVGDLDDPERRVGDGQPERLGDLLPDRALGELAVGLEAAALAVAEGGLRRDVAEHDVGVGDRRLGAAAVVADRPGQRARALRPDAQAAAVLVDPGDRAAAGADRDHLERRHAVAELAEQGVVGGQRRAVLDDPDVEARAAHVGGDDVAGPELLGDRARSRSGRRPAPSRS